MAQRTLQALAPHSQQPVRDTHISREPDQLLTEAEACAFVKVFNVRKHPVRQFADWARRAGVPVKRVGRARLYSRVVLEAFLERKPWTKRHRVA